MKVSVFLEFVLEYDHVAANTFTAPPKGPIHLPDQQQI